VPLPASQSRTKYSLLTEHVWTFTDSPALLRTSPHSLIMLRNLTDLKPRDFSFCSQHQSCSDKQSSDTLFGGRETFMRPSRFASIAPDLFAFALYARIKATPRLPIA